MKDKSVVAQPNVRKQYTIDVPEFAGPLDLLLHLIDRNELDITEISLAEVTDQYLAQVEKLRENRVPQLIDFIVIGARMMVIKSRALLPAPPVVLEGEEEEDPAEALLRQLRIYKQFKDAAQRLSARDEAGLRTYLRLAPPIKVESKLDLSGVSADTLLLTMIAILNRHEVRRDSVSVARPREITISEQISKLRDTARRGRRFSFGALLSADASRVELSVTLLALLELIKRQEVTAEQENLFGPIEINRAEPEPESMILTD
jgi:segregation and condensation protein A